MSQDISPSSIHRLADRLREADAITAELFSDVIRDACWRLPSVRRTRPFNRLTELIQSCAWTDAALALLALELPRWQIRRIVHDAGEWHCSLSRLYELPEWLDQPIETNHTDLSLAILSALVDAQSAGMSPMGSGASTPPDVNEQLYTTLCCDNFA